MTESFAFFFPLTLVFLVISFIGGCRVGIDSFEKKATQDGVAYYSVNPTNSETTFKWKEIK